MNSAGLDRYGRTLGTVYAGPANVNAALVRQGAAWVYRRYAQDRALYRLPPDQVAPGQLPADQLKLLADYRRLTPRHQEMVRETAAAYLVLNQQKSQEPAPAARG